MSILLLIPICFALVAFTIWFLVTGTRLPKITGLKVLMPSSKTITVVAVALVTATAIVLAWRYLDKDTAGTIVASAKTYWVWIAGGLVIAYLLWKERGLARFAIGLVMVGALIVGVANFIKTGDFTTSKNACPTSRTIIVQDGTAVTVSKGCPVMVDQTAMKSGADIVLTDPELRSKTPSFGLVKYTSNPNGTILTLIPNQSGYESAGLEQVQVEFYDKGTGNLRVAERHGVYTPKIDMTPAASAAK